MSLTLITKVINNKKVVFQPIDIAIASAKNFKNDVTQNQQFSSSVDNFIKQNETELKTLLSDYDGLIISLTDALNTKLEIHEKTTNFDNEKIGKIFFNLDELLNLSTE